jgi:hypothetical protein
MPRRLAGPRLAAPLAWAVLCAGACLAPGPAAADESPRSTPRWKLLKGVSVSDTVAAPRAEAYDATVAMLLKEGWTIAEDHSDSTRIVTEWKPIRHLLARLAAGEVRARCMVRLAPAGPERTALTLDGRLAVPAGAGENPMLGLAQRTYEEKSRSFLKNVGKELARRDGGGAGGSAAPAPTRR